VDPETRSAIDKYIEAFGSLNLTIINVNFDAPGVKERFIAALEDSIASGNRVTNEDLGFTIPDGALT
jgi:hypothetical protein